MELWTDSEYEVWRCQSLAQIVDPPRFSGPTLILPSRATKALTTSKIDKPRQEILNRQGDILQIKSIYITEDDGVWICE
jgi:hypothetical protein